MTTEEVRVNAGLPFPFATRFTSTFLLRRFKTLDIERVSNPDPLDLGELDLLMAPVV